MATHPHLCRVESAGLAVVVLGCSAMGDRGRVPEQSDCTALQPVWRCPDRRCYGQLLYRGMTVICIRTPHMILSSFFLGLTIHCTTLVPLSTPAEGILHITQLTAHSSTDRYYGTCSTDTGEVSEAAAAGCLTGVLPVPSATASSPSSVSVTSASVVTSAFASRKLV